MTTAATAFGATFVDAIVVNPGNLPFLTLLRAFADTKTLTGSPSTNRVVCLRLGFLCLIEEYLTPHARVTFLPLCDFLPVSWQMRDMLFLINTGAMCFLLPTYLNMVAGF